LNSSAYIPFLPSWDPTDFHLCSLRGNEAPKSLTLPFRSPTEISLASCSGLNLFFPHPCEPLSVGLPDPSLPDGWRSMRIADSLSSFGFLSGLPSFFFPVRRFYLIAVKTFFLLSTLIPCAGMKASCFLRTFPTKFCQPF